MYSVLRYLLNKHKSLGSATDKMELARHAGKLWVQIPEPHKPGMVAHACTLAQEDQKVQSQPQVYSRPKASLDYISKNKPAWYCCEGHQAAMARHEPRQGRQCPVVVVVLAFASRDKQCS